MSNIYNINWYRLIKMLVLPAVNRPTVLAFLNAFMAPVRSNYAGFLQFKSESDYRVQHTGQVCYLQKLLNDKFDPALRRIKVENAVPKVPLWVYYPEDDKPVFVYNETDHPVFVYNPEDYYTEYDFKVKVPAGLASMANQMMAQINYYKIFSKNYQIVEL